MNQSHKDLLKKAFALIIKFLVLTFIGILIWNIFFYTNIYLLIGAIVFLSIVGIFGLVSEIREVYADDDKNIRNIMQKWIESDKEGESKVALLCPKCGHEFLSLDTNFCSNCGHVLKQE